MQDSSDDESGDSVAEADESAGSDQTSDTDDAAPPQMDLSELKERLQSVKPRTWGAVIVLVVIVVLIVTRCGSNGGGEQLAVADARGNLYVVAADSFTTAELDVDRRIGRLIELPSEDAPLIHLFRDNSAGVPTWVTQSSMVMDSSGQRLMLIDDRRTGLRLERGSTDVELGDGEEVASGEVELVLYYFDEDVLYFEERVTSNTQSCHVSKSGDGPTRIGTGQDCRFWPAAGLVEVRNARDITLFDYEAEERLQLDLSNFGNPDLYVLDEGRAIAATLEADDGLTELVVGTVDGEQSFVTRNDIVKILAVSEIGSSFVYVEREAGETPHLMLWHDGDSSLISRGSSEYAAIAPDGSAAVAVITGEDDLLEVWFAALDGSDADFELIYEAHEDDIFYVDAYWSGAVRNAMVLAANGRDERDDITELRVGSEVTELAHSEASSDSWQFAEVDDSFVWANPQAALVPVGDSLVWLSQQSTGSQGFAVAERVDNGEVVDDELLEGEIVSFVVVDDRTMAVVADRLGTMYLTMISLQGDDIETFDLLASNRIDNLVAISGRVYARSESRFGIEELVTARPGDTDAESLGEEAAQIVAVLTRDLTRFSQGRWP